MKYRIIHSSFHMWTAISKWLMTSGHAPGLSLRRCCSIGPVGLETERERDYTEKWGFPAQGWNKKVKQKSVPNCLASGCRTAGLNSKHSWSMGMHSSHVILCDRRRCRKGFMGCGGEKKMVALTSTTSMECFSASLRILWQHSICRIFILFAFIKPFPPWMMYLCCLCSLKNKVSW